MCKPQHQAPGDRDHTGKATSRQVMNLSFATNALQERSTLRYFEGRNMLQASTLMQMTTPDPAGDHTQRALSHT